MKSDYYILDGREPVPAATVLEWAEWRATADRQVCRDTIGEVLVSTVFLGIDHNWGGGAPHIFETMVFGGQLEGEQERYSTWDQAEQGHAEMVRRVLAAET